jgi:hypothetical protein
VLSKCKSRDFRVRDSLLYSMGKRTSWTFLPFNEARLTSDVHNFSFLLTQAFLKTSSYAYQLWLSLSFLKTLMQAVIRECVYFSVFSTSNSLHQDSTGSHRKLTLPLDLPYLNFSFTRSTHLYVCILFCSFIARIKVTTTTIKIGNHSITRIPLIVFYLLFFVFLKIFQLWGLNQGP